MRFRVLVLAFIVCIAFTAPSLAQNLPQPSGPVLFCGTQAAPEATSYTVSIDGANPVALTMDQTIDEDCPTDQGITHSFKLSPTPFTVGTHTVVVYATNAFGTTTGDEYEVTVGIAPGKFTIKHVGVKQGD